MTLSRVIEALLFSAQKPLAAKELAEVIRSAGAEDEFSPNEFAKTREPEVAAALEQLKIEYIEQQRAFQLIEKNEGWQLTTDPACAPWVRCSTTSTCCASKWTATRWWCSRTAGR